MIRRSRFVVGLASLIVAAGLGYALRAARAAGIPAANAMSYAGVLEDATGPITGMHNIQLYVYDAATAGNILCQSAPAALGVINGRFTVPLPDTCTAAVGTNSDAWVDVLVDGSDTGRTKIGAVPYAVEANHAVNATNAVNATTATSAGHASTSDMATSATNATTAANATTATTAMNASTSDMATNATNAAHAATADSATNATNATIANDSSAVCSYLTSTEPGCGGGNQIFFGWNGELQVQVDNEHLFAFAPSMSKTFVIDHPTDRDRYLVHATLEGPESAVFYRGTGRLHGGTTEITLPAYFEAETRLDGRTIMVTPKFETTTEPISMLGASAVRQGGFIVRAIDERNSEQAFDWEVKAVRADVPQLTVEPQRNDVVVHGEGPYRYLTSKAFR